MRKECLDSRNVKEMTGRPTVMSRTVNGKSHVLNYTTGEVMSFDVEEKDIIELITSWANSNLDISDEVREFFAEVGERPNTRLCRANLVEVGMHFSFPTIVNLELNKRCNLRCIHCYIGDGDLKSPVPSIFDTMTTAQIDDFLNSLRAIGVFLIVLTGGEPFLCRNIEQIVRMAVEKDFVLEIFSNLQHVPSWFLRADPSSTRIGRIQTSVYSADPKIHNKITTVSGSFKRTVSNLRFLKEMGHYVEVATPLMSVNFGTRNETETLFRNLGIRQNFAWPIVNEYQNSVSGKALLNISSDQVEQFALERPDFFIQLDTECLDEPICAAGRALFGITCGGDVWPCSQYPLTLGNIRRENICQILKSPTMSEIANRTKVMLRDEVAFNFCMGMNYAETGDPFRQADLMIRNIARVQKKERR